jgi:TolA-binding protein
VASHLGEVYWQLKKPDKAVKLWREALQRFPDTHHVRDTVDRLDVDLHGVYE